jgi:Mn-dependent DtxR family transcriptional regulator
MTLTEPQAKLLELTKRGGGMIYVEGPQVRVARRLSALGYGELEDYGGIELRDGERWTFTLHEKNR